jgi:hypothetical protein
MRVRKPSELKGADRSANAVLRAFDFRADDARGAGGSDGAPEHIREFQMEGQFLADL